jgi:hypothetical protein
MARSGPGCGEPPMAITVQRSSWSAPRPGAPGHGGKVTSGQFPFLQDQAVAAVLIQRFFAAYLPPVWGWATLTWMRRREYV